MKLSAENFQKARNYILTHGRDLEKAQFKHHFENGSADAVLEALTEYQNPDGGFGNAIEPDIRCVPSTPIGTTTGIQILRELGISADNRLVKGAIDYLLISHHALRERWDFNTPAMNSAPHAPWWTFDEKELLPHGFDSNPSAEIVGHLWHYKALVPQHFLETVTEHMMAYLDEMPATIQLNAMLNWIRTVSADNLPEAHRQKIQEKLLAIVDDVVERDPAKWGGYVAKPLEFAKTPASPLADVLAADVQVNLDYEIGRQGSDGAWAPNWSWFGNYPDVWPQAEREWKGVLTLHMLHSLTAYDRL